MQSKSKYTYKAVITPPEPQKVTLIEAKDGLLICKEGHLPHFVTTLHDDAIGYIEELVFGAEAKED